MEEDLNIVFLSFLMVSFDGKLKMGMDYLIHFYGKEGDLEGTHYDNIFRSGTVTYTGSVTEDKLVFKLDAVLANGKSLKFWLEFKQSYQ